MSWAGWIWRQVESVARDDFPLIPIVVVAGVLWWTWRAEERAKRREWEERKRRGFEVKGRGSE